MATTCDLCGKKDTRLTTLKDIYQVDGIKEICGECEDTINKQSSKMMTVLMNMKVHWLQQFIRNLIP